MADDLRDRYAEKLTRACSHFTDDPECAEMTADGLAAVRDAELERLRAELAEMRRELEATHVRAKTAVKRRNDVKAERDALKTAIQHHAAEAHRRKWAHGDTNRDAFNELHRLGNELLAALDTPGTATDSEETDHVDAHGRSWDPHPFAQSRAVDNLKVCICGLTPDHQIHHRAPDGEGDGRPDHGKDPYRCDDPHCESCYHRAPDSPADARTDTPGMSGTREALRDAQEGS